MTRGVLVFRLVGAALAIAAIALTIGLHGPAKAMGEALDAHQAQAEMPYDLERQV